MIPINIRQLLTENFFVTGGYLANTVKVEVLVDEIEKCYLDPGDYDFWKKSDHKLPPNSKES